MKQDYVISIKSLECAVAGLVHTFNWSSTSMGTTYCNLLKIDTFSLWEEEALIYRIASVWGRTKYFENDRKTESIVNQINERVE